jgi:NAD(P)-dependent dehydrogenase (short-subunit alcohol dehydrogenase family)
VTIHRILLTGASSGIGRAIALAYAGPGVHLLLIARNVGRLAEVAGLCRAAGAGVETASLDVRDEAAMHACILAWDETAPIDLAIACAGIVSGTGPDRAVETQAAVRAVLATDLIGALNTIDPLLEPMMARRAGHVAVVGSLSGLRGFPSSPAYSAAKAGVQAYAEGIRPRLKRHGVAVSVIAPGFVETPLNRAVRAPRPLQMSPQAAARIIKRGLERRRSMIAFPLVLYAGLRLLTLLPAAFGDWLLDRPDVEVPLTAEQDRFTP